MAKTYALDVFELLNKINDPKIADIYADLTEDERAGFAPLVVLRWMSGSSDGGEIVAVNEFANRYVFSLGRHPHLLMLLMQACSSKRKKRYNWVASKTEVKRALTTKVMQEYFGMSQREVQRISRPPAHELLTMAESIGWQPEDLAKLKKEIESHK